MIINVAFARKARKRLWFFMRSGVVIQAIFCEGHMSISTGTTLNRHLLASVAGAVLLTAAGQAMAGGLALREQSPAAQGEAFAGVAAGAGGISSMYWNPATMTKYTGWNSSWGFSFLAPDARISPTPGPLTPTAAFGPSGNMFDPVVLPSSYSTYQFNDSLWFGLAINSPFGLATKSNRDWSGQVYGRTSEARTLSINPSIAFKLNDMLSFGVGINVMQFKTRLTSAQGAAPGAAGAELKGDAWGVGFTAGATFTPWEGTELGIGYRSQVRENLKGTFINALAAGGLPPAAAIGGAYSITSNVTLPDMVTLGLRQRVNTEWTVLAGFEWTRWSVFNTFPVCITGPAPFPALAGCPAALALSFQYKNSWYASLGAEYKWSPNLTLRGGLGYEKSPINDSNRGLRLPDSDRIWATVGAGYQISNKLSVDVSYAHVFGKSGGVNIVPGNPAFNGVLPYVGTTKAHVDIVSLAVNYRWDDPKVAIPVVAKY